MILLVLFFEHICNHHSIFCAQVSTPTSPASFSHNPVRNAKMKSDKEQNDAKAAVLVQSQPMPADATVVQGIDFDRHADKEVTVDEMMRSMKATGFQASNLGRAVEIIDQMVCQRK